jgi:hypothetical protein
MAANDAPETVTDALALLARDGYVADFNIRRGAIACPGCHHEHPVDQSIIERVYRFEGPSDPADEAIVLGLRCPTCGLRGSYVSSFGPNADPDAMAGLSYLAGRPSAPTASRPIPPSGA